MLRDFALYRLVSRVPANPCGFFVGLRVGTHFICAFAVRLAIQEMILRPAYTIPEVANLFRVSVRTIQDRIARGLIIVRNVPGRAGILPADLEAVFTRTKNKGKR